MKIKMYLETDTIFSDGSSTPGGVDLQILTDEFGFPYYKSSTFKGVFKEALENYLDWTSSDQKETILHELLGTGGSYQDSYRKLKFSDFKLSDNVRNSVLLEIQNLDSGFRKTVVRESLTNVRTFIRINDQGISDDGSLRSARVVNKGLYFYCELKCDEGDKQLIADVLSMIKWVGTKRNRGFGKVKFSICEEV